MKDIKDYLQKYTPDRLAKNQYYYEQLLEFYNEDIPDKYLKLYENFDLYNNEFITESLKTHDSIKLQNKLLKEYNDIEFKDYSGENKKSFYIILPNNYRIFDFYNDAKRLDADFDNIEKFNNILSFYNYYISYTEKIDNKWALFIEPRYSDEITNQLEKNHISLYHFTDGESAKSILKNGLRIKKSKYREFPERIFLYAANKNLSDDKANVCSFILKVCNRSKIHKYGLSILKLNIYHKDIKIYNDTAMKEKEAVFVYENIPAEYIKEITIKNINNKEIYKYFQ